MPNWKIHLEIGKRLNKYFNYNKEDLNLFLLGTILPDINNCYIVTDISKQIDHDITHFGTYKDLNYTDFYKKYKSEIDNKKPVFNGYMAHIYTDNMWNRNFYYNKFQKLDNLPENRDEIRKMKQSDFKVYNNKYIKDTLEINNIDTSLEEIKKIDEVSITKEDILKVINFLDNQKKYVAKLNFYSMEELDNLMENTITEYANLLKK